MWYMDGESEINRRSGQSPKHLQTKEIETLTGTTGVAVDNYKNVVKGKGKVKGVPVHNKLSTIPGRHMEEWWYSSTTVDLRTRWE
jgi:hypothetical protein